MALNEVHGVQNEVIVVFSRAYLTRYSSGAVKMKRLVYIIEFIVCYD